LEDKCALITYVTEWLSKSANRKMGWNIIQTKVIRMNDEKYEKAKKRVEELKSFYGNLATYAGINAVLIIINLVTSPGSLWFYWVTIFWGIGILIHASKVFIFKGKFLGEEWERRKIKQIMENEENKKGGH
jgi:hypothetical protein